MMPAIPQKFYDIIEGLIYYSESDNPYSIELLQSKSLQQIPSEIAALNSVSETSVRNIDADAFFKHIADAADTNDEIIAANAARTEALHVFLKENTSDLTVYRIESGVRIPIYIVGALEDNSFVAVKTMSVET